MCQLVCSEIARRTRYFLLDGASLYRLWLAIEEITDCGRDLFGVLMALALRGYTSVTGLFILGEETQLHPSCRYDDIQIYARYIHIV